MQKFKQSVNADLYANRIVKVIKIDVSYFIVFGKWKKIG